MSLVYVEFFFLECCLERVSVPSCDLGLAGTTVQAAQGRRSEHGAVQPPALHHLQPFLPLCKVILQGLLQCGQDGAL